MGVGLATECRTSYYKPHVSFWMPEMFLCAVTAAQATERIDSITTTSEFFGIGNEYCCGFVDFQ